MARSEIAFSLEIFNLARNLENFLIVGPSGKIYAGSGLLHAMTWPFSENNLHPLKLKREGVPEMGTKPLKALRGISGL